MRRCARLALICENILAIVLKLQMPPPKRVHLRCFMAMAFDHNDTDAMYATVKRALSPAITVVRIDRIEHNDDIDDRIISEIERADFVIADLTYARPSVYFEAGYAQRKVPVVYTARRDHFRDKPDDPHGNLKVHFDLQMKNIVPWESPKDPVFLLRLKKRIGKVVSPLISQKVADDTQKKKIAAFNALSFHAKHAFVISAAKSSFRRLGYKVIPLASDKNAIDSSLLTAPMPIGAGIAAIKQSRSEYHFVVIHTTPGITKQLCDLYGLISWHPIYSQMFQDKPSKRIREDVVICSFGSGGFKRLQKNIGDLSAGDADGTLISDKPYRSSTYPYKDQVPRRTTYHVFESASRLLALGAVFSERFR